MDLARLQQMVKDRQTTIDARKTSGTQLAKIPAGTSRWRILPGWRKEAPEVYFHDFGQHWIKNADAKVVAVIVSEADTFGRADPIGELVWGAYRATNDEDTKKRIRELASKRVVLVNAVQIAGAGADPNKVVLLGMPNGLATKFHETLTQRLEYGINMLDMQKGRDVVITKSGTGLNTEYSMVDAPVESAVDEALLAQLINIDAFIAGEREKGLQKDVNLVNEALARAITGNATGGRASLMSVAPPAAAAVTAPALAAPAPAPVAVAPLPTVAAAPAPVAVAAAPVAPPPAVVPPGAPVGDSEIIEDEELAKLLGQLS